ncbi:MAG: hypothetical protein QXQ77_00725 [Candidatus Aenigmatarchaeota archaeon]
MRKGQTSSLVVFSIIIFIIGLVVNYLPVTLEGGKTLPQAMAETLGLNPSDMLLPNFIFWVFVPLVGSTAMILALLNIITGWMITDKNLNLVIAFTWALVAILTPARYVVWGLFAIFGAWGIAVYGFIFIFGSFLLGRAFYRKPEKFLMRSISGDITKLTLELDKARRELLKAQQKGQTEKVAILKKRVKDLEWALKEQKELERSFTATG